MRHLGSKEPWREKRHLSGGSSVPALSTCLRTVFLVLASRVYPCAFPLLILTASESPDFCCHAFLNTTCLLSCTCECCCFKFRLLWSSVLFPSDRDTLCRQNFLTPCAHIFAYLSFISTNISARRRKGRGFTLS